MPPLVDVPREVITLLMLNVCTVVPLLQFPPSNHPFHESVYDVRLPPLEIVYDDPFASDELLKKNDPLLSDFGSLNVSMGLSELFSTDT
jgi:hypothetical protein